MQPSTLKEIPSADASVAAAIAAAEPFRDLPDQVIEALAASASHRAYAAGETVLAMGQYDGSEFMLVQSGKIRATFADPASGAMHFEDAAVGEIFGLEIAVAGGEGSRAATISLTAERDADILAIDAELLRELAKDRPSLTRNLMLYFARRLSGAVAETQETSPERRVYAALASYVERDAATAEWKIARMPKHRDLAESADVDESEAANAVAKLIQSGVARRDYPGLVIDDIAQLNRLAR
jgi:CRP-like cAMP-binding protein